MKPFQTLANARTAEGDELTLHEHDGDYFINLNGQPLMGTKATASEAFLAELTCGGLEEGGEARVLIGGLGMGFTLRAVLELAGSGTMVEVAELIPEVVAWNGEHLGEVNGALLEDSRVEVVIGDVCEVIAGSEGGRYDAILLDVDNGPVPMVQRGNERLYGGRGLGMIMGALRPGGCVGFWSASSDRSFSKRLSKAGFSVEVHAAKAYEGAKRASHTIYIARRR
jgi:spermidine synthase